MVLYFIIVETRYDTPPAQLTVSCLAADLRRRYVPLEEIVKCFDGDDVAAVANAEIQKQGEKGFSTSVQVVEHA